MNRQINPNLVAAILTRFTVLFLAIMQVRIQFIPNGVEAQETPNGLESVLVAQADSKLVEYTLRSILGQTPPMAYIGVEVKLTDRSTRYWSRM